MIGRKPKKQEHEWLRQASRRYGLLLTFVLILPACVSWYTRPRPMAEWQVRRHPLYPPTVWVETAGGKVGGGVIVSSEPGSTFVLTAYHVVEGQTGIRVGVLRHSQVRPPQGTPEYRRYASNILVGGYLIDERLRAAFEECAAAFAALVMSAGGAAEYPMLSRVIRTYKDLTESLDAARGYEDVRSAISRFIESKPFAETDRLREELVAAASAIGADPAYPERIKKALEGSVDATRRLFDRRDAAVCDVALLRLETNDHLHACACHANGADAAIGATGQLVSIYPDREPRVRDVRLGGFRQGQSGCPVFVDGLLAGILTNGLYPADEEPGETFEEGVFVRIDDIHAWLARHRLEGLLSCP